MPAGKNAEVTKMGNDRTTFRMDRHEEIPAGSFHDKGPNPDLMPAGKFDDSCAPGTMPAGTFDVEFGTSPAPDAPQGDSEGGE